MVRETQGGVGVVELVGLECVGWLEVVGCGTMDVLAKIYICFFFVGGWVSQGMNPKMIQIVILEVNLFIY